MTGLAPTSRLAIDHIRIWADRNRLDFRSDPRSGAGAVFSRCGAYRYLLWRRAAFGQPFLAFAMLNPSTADEAGDDATIRRCTALADRARMAGPLVWNLFAYRATRPQSLKAERLPIGIANDSAIALALQLAGRTIAAWGCHGGFRQRDGAVLALCAKAGAELHALRLTRRGHPGHPLFLPNSTSPQPWSYPR